MTLVLSQQLLATKPGLSVVTAQELGSCRQELTQTPCRRLEVQGC